MQSLLLSNFLLFFRTAKHSNDSKHNHECTRKQFFFQIRKFESIYRSTKLYSDFQTYDILDYCYVYPIKNSVHPVILHNHVT